MTEVKAGVVLAVGIVLAGLSGVVWLALGSDRAACSNTLVSALASQSCGKAGDWSAVSVVGFLAGLGVIAWGLVIANRKPKP